MPNLLKLLSVKNVIIKGISFWHVICQFLINLLKQTNEAMLEQLIILTILVLSGFSAIGFLFWLLFKKDAPSEDDLKSRYNYN